MEQAPQVNMKFLTSKTSKMMKNSGTNKLQRRKLKENLKVKTDKLKDSSWIVNSLPKKYRAKAFSLLRYIVRNYKMKWDSKGTFIYKNKIIPKSNIVHLVLHALLPNITAKPPGMMSFYKGLMETNVPEFLVANKLGKLIITGREEELKSKSQ